MPRPIPMGVSIGNVDHEIMSGLGAGDRTSGTAGAFVIDGNGYPAILSASHVLAGFGTLPLGSSITQPGPAYLAMPKGQKNPYGGKNCNPTLEAMDGVATLTGYVAPVDTGPNETDSAIAESLQPNPSSLASNSVNNIGVPSATPFGPGTKGLAVQQKGATTCYRAGRIVDTNFSFLLGPIEWDGTYLANFTELEGDSGRSGGREGAARRRWPSPSLQLAATRRSPHQSIMP